MIEIKRICDMENCKNELVITEENIENEDTGVILHNGIAIVQVQYLCSECTKKVFCEGRNNTTNKNK